MQITVAAEGRLTEHAPCLFIPESMEMSGVSHPSMHHSGPACVQPTRVHTILHDLVYDAHNFSPANTMLRVDAAFIFCEPFAIGIRGHD